MREQRLEDDLKAARKLQSVLLPREAPPIAGLEIAIALLARSAVISTTSSNVGISPSFGDVSGKGAAAALYGALVSGLPHTLCHTRRTPAQLLKLINDVLSMTAKGAMTFDSAPVPNEWGQVDEVNATTPRLHDRASRDRLTV